MKVILLILVMCMAIGCSQTLTPHQAANGTRCGQRVR
jgi:hypothetical protein